MTTSQKIIRLVFVSPISPLLFLILPASLLLSRLLHLHLPFDITTTRMLTNNICLLLCLAVRFVRYLFGMRRAMRYGSDRCAKCAPVILERPAAQVRGDLAKAGFRFDNDQNYGEKRNPGYLGVTLIYGGLTLLLTIGVWDNLRQFSGTVIKGPGAPIDLSVAEKYYHLVTGPLASPAGIPLLKVTKQIFPDKTYPLGATEIALIGKDGKRVGGAFIDGNKGPYSYGGYDYFLNGLLVDFALTIKTKGSFENNVFDDAVKLMPLYENKAGDFSLYGTFTTPSGDEGEAWFDPTHEVFKIALTHGGKKILDTDFVFQRYREKEAGDYVVSILGAGHWSEIHIVRGRHMSLLIAGGILALFGLLLRVLFRPQRVWLEESGDGCRAWITGKEAEKALK